MPKYIACHSYHAEPYYVELNTQKDLHKGRLKSLK